MPFLPLPIHTSYDIDLPPLPVVRLEEAISEKLARYTRVALARDLFDLIWYGRCGTIDHNLIRKLWILKIYNDVVLDKRWGNRSFNPREVLAPRPEAEIDDENIGYLTQPADISAWEIEFRSRYAFLAELTNDENQWASCQAGRRYEFTQLIAQLS